MQEITKESVQESLDFIRRAKAELEKELADSITLRITEFYNKTGLPITDVMVDLSTSTTLEGNTMSYITGIYCRNSTLETL